ncbi:SCO family protein [Flavobacterium sp. W22_SRS_FP1]|uniref:SCO family protein n=1 Tax=Flavobacterium sp. W22_SRS_FP1 TaxID=3240276 RepID=UPI003F9281E3
MKLKYLIIPLFLLLLSCQDKELVRKLPYYNTSDFTPVWELPTDKPFHSIRAFQLTDQEGKSFTEKNIENKICVVDFFFTSCPGICPKMTNSMSLLQKEFIKDDAILLLSHTVTPEQDSVSVLADYGKKKNVQYNKWKLLTGTKDEIYNLGRKFYFVEEDLGENKDNSIFLHTENFVLIDKSRIIRGIYNSLDPTSMASLSEDIKVLEKE